MLKGYKTLPKAAAVEVEVKPVVEAGNAEHIKEFAKYLQDKLVSQPKNDFFNSMKTKMEAGKLTENMVAALRKCKERDEKPAEAPKSAQRTITLKIRQWLMKDLGIDSRIITGKVLQETNKAYQIEGHADFLVNACWCMRCGRELTEPASQITGFGSWCAAEVGVTYDPKGVLLASKAERAAIRRQYAEVLHNQKFERWIPKSQVEEIVTEPTEKVAKVKAPKKTQSDVRTAAQSKKDKKLSEKIHK